MIYTWLGDVSPLLEEEAYRQCYEQVPGFRKEKADRIRHRKGRAQSVGAWALWEKMKAAYGLSEEAPFNLSHSGQYVLCAAADQPGVKVGCDAETVKELRMQVARRFYCPSETAYIEGLETEEEKRDAFYRYWVLKESFMKAVKKGMALDTRSFEIGFDKEDRPFLKQRPKEYEEAYFYREFSMDGVNAKIAVCSTDKDFADLRKESLLAD